MKLPKDKCREKQLYLFDRTITSKGEARWACGEFFEEASVAVSGGVRLRTDATCDICPDLRFDTKTFGEVKASGRNSSVIFYERRFEKDRDFEHRTGNEIIYMFWRHRYPVLQATTFEGLYQSLSQNTLELFLVDSRLLTQATFLKPPRIVNSGYTNDGRETGYGKNGTGSGWTFRMSFFREHSRRLPFDLNPVVCGIPMKSVAVYLSQPRFSKIVQPKQEQLALAFGVT